MLISFAPLSHDRARGVERLIRHRIDRAAEVGDLETQNHVGVADERAGIGRLIEGMAGGEIHAAILVDHRGLQRFGEFDQALHTSRRARGAIGNDDGILRRDEKPAASSTAPESPWAARHGQLGTRNRLLRRGIFL